MENINKTVREKLKALKECDQSFKAIFEIIHNMEDKVFCEISDGFRIKKTTYKEAKSDSIKTAKYLGELLKDEPKGNFVGLLMENSYSWVLCFWGLLMSGYKPMLINGRLSDELNNNVIDMLHIKAIVGVDNKLKAKTYLFDIEKIKEYDDSAVDFVWADELALSTSATSMNVKVCVYDSVAICKQIANTKNILKNNKMVKQHYDGSLKQLCFLPFYHVFGLIAVYFWFAFFSRCFVFLKDYSADTILNTVRKHKVTHVFGVPMLWHSIYKGLNATLKTRSDKDKAKFEKGIKLSNTLQNINPYLGKKLASKMFKEVQDKIFGDSIKFMISGGGYLSEDCLKTLNGIGYPLHVGYGMSEIGITSVELRSKIKYRNLESVGRPFESVEYDIKDGILYVKGESICKRIYTKTETIDIKKDEWFKTNDIVRKDKSLSYYIIGRNDDIIIKEGGEKINPDLIEKNLFIPSANNYSVLGLDVDGKTKACLIIEINKNVNQLMINRIVNEVENNINELNKLNYHIDKIYYTNDAIIAATAIKVSRSILKKWINDGKVKLLDYSDFENKKVTDVDVISNELSEKVKEIFAFILKKDKNDIDPLAHFIFDLGGTSLDYISLLIKMKEEFGEDFSTSEQLYCANDFVKYIMK